METAQTTFWTGQFGKDYTDRNTFDQDAWDKFYLENWGVTKIEMNDGAIGFLNRDSKILEVGCNIGLQLAGFQRMGFKRLYGVEIQEYAVEKAKEITKGVNVIQGSGFDLPFKDNFFDLVCTNGVLIHIHPENYDTIMSEMYRCVSKYIMGFEYYSECITSITYRENEDYLWKNDFAEEFVRRYSDLKIVHKRLYPYISVAGKGNVDYVYLLEKTK